VRAIEIAATAGAGIATLINTPVTITHRSAKMIFLCVVVVM
jgi:hypothetical protein